MSADNYLAIRKKGKDWLVLEGCESTGFEEPVNERVRVTTSTRTEAINEANYINQNENIEYGISFIEPDIEDQDINKFVQKVDRFEVIDETGRAYVKGSIYGTPVKVELSVQDGGKTLKVFVEATNGK